MIVPVTMPDAAVPMTGAAGSVVAGVVAGVVTGAVVVGARGVRSRAGVLGTRAPNRLAVTSTSGRSITCALAVLQVNNAMHPSSARYRLRRNVPMIRVLRLRCPQSRAAR